jgi:pimeloyl-ACP methyl ester carboxylesterase
VHAEVFANHDGKKALHEVLRLLDSGGNGNPSSTEKAHAKIIIYGHSWGAAETVVFARELGKQGIPVQLTIQMDSIAKPGRDDSRIPSNVANAINFYQSRGPLQGLTEIVATDPAQTTIVGNFHMTYQGHRINCANYPWYARTLNKPHHELENDPRVWDLAASLIDSEVEGRDIDNSDFVVLETVCQIAVAPVLLSPIPAFLFPLSLVPSVPAFLSIPSPPPTPATT